MALRIVSLNCWGGRLHEPLLKYLKDVDADVYCLQEILSSPQGTPTFLTYEEDKPVRTRLFEEIKNVLSDHQAFFYPAAQGYLHDGAKTEFNARYGLATFVRNSVPIIGEAVGFVYGVYRTFAWGDPPLPRNAHAIRIWRYDNRTPLVIAHMHGMWIASGKEDTPERIEQARNLLRIVRGIITPGDEIIVCGDFNVLPGSATFQALEYINLRDLVTSRGFNDTRTSYYKKAPRNADYMFVSDRLQIQSFDAPALPEVSDHRPLVLDSKY